MVTAVLLPNAKASFITSSGAPAVGYKVYTYDAGTLVPRTTYLDAAGGANNTNPIILDARGEAVIYWDGSYKVVLKDPADVVIWTADNVSQGPLSTPTPWAVAGGSADAITATYSPAITALTDGLLLGFRASAANATATPTFSPNGLTARTIVKAGGGDIMFAGDIARANVECLVRYNLANTRWELLNPTRGNGFFLAPQSITVAGATGDVLTLRGGAATRMQLTLGRSAADWTVGIASAVGNYVTGSVAGDLAFVTNAQQFIVSTDNGVSASFICSTTDIFAPNASTTASAANVFMDNAASNKIKRVTSSLLYKDDFQPFDGSYSGPIIDALTPGTYLSLAPDDDPKQRHLGMLAEDVAPIAPELVVFIPTANRKGLAPAKQSMAAYLSAHQTADGTVPDSINYDRLPVILLAEIKSLRARLAAAGIA